MTSRLEPAYRIRTFSENDREAVKAIGTPVVDWWNGEPIGASLHLVVEKIETGELVGHLQARDRSVPAPSRRTGQCHFNLSVCPNHRRCGIGGTLYDRLETFARNRQATTLYAGYVETTDAPAATFLRNRGFKILERFLPSYLDLNQFNTKGLDRPVPQGITLTTYAALGDAVEQRHKLHDLEEKARAQQPFREVEPYIETSYLEWEMEFSNRDPSTIILALARGEMVGVITRLQWGFTGVDPDWCGRGVATALKIYALQEAKARGLARIETENHEDNLAMLAINRKLGFIFTTPEVACVKHLSSSPTPSITRE